VSVFLRSALVILVLLAITLALGIGRIQAFLDSPLSIEGEEYILEVKPGTSFAAVSRGLYESGVLAHPEWFRWYGRLTGKASRIHAGEYSIETGTSPRQLLEELIRGQVLLHSMTIIEGWRYRDLLGALRDHLENIQWDS
jgi:UPF0755 protein